MLKRLVALVLVIASANSAIPRINKGIVKMCYDLNEYDPFETLYIYSDNGYWELELDSEPMTEDDWEEYLTIGE